jgi:hypothetical protein
MSALVLPGVTAAEANWGRWVARCSWCPSAITAEPGLPAYRCVECARWNEVVWPDADMVHGVLRLLSMRPDVTTQNWLPGETLVDLMIENGQHGIFDGATDDFVVEEGRIRMDALPGSAQPLKAVA